MNKAIAWAVIVCFGVVLLIINTHFEKSQRGLTSWVEQKRSSVTTTIRATEIDNTTQCNKKHPNQTYKTCTELPFSKIKCGPAYSRSKPVKDQPYVVPDIIFYIWFGKGRTFQYFNYLSLRSAAAVHQPERIDFYHNNSLPIGKYWEKAKSEIPCLNLVETEMPIELNGYKIGALIQRTDVARLQILKENGGIYLDGDVIVVNNMDQLRTYPATVGRSTIRNICICSVIARKHSFFIKEYYNYVLSLLPKYPNVPWMLFTIVLADFVRTTKVKVHIEETSLNRPNAYVVQDNYQGRSTLTSPFDLSDNYVYHIHPGKVNVRGWLSWDEEVLRKEDGVYGEAARIALFGAPEMVFKPGEKAFEMQKKIKFYPLPPILQKNAVIEDIGD